MPVRCRSRYPRTAQMAGIAVLDKADVGDASGAITTFVFFGTKFMHDRPQTALAFLRALVRGARDAQGDYLKDPKIAASIAQQTGLKVERSKTVRPMPSIPTSTSPSSRRVCAIRRRCTAKMAVSIIPASSISRA